MKPSLFYECPLCGQAGEVALKVIDNAIKNNALNCQHCSAQLALTGDAEKVIAARHQDIKNLIPMQFIGMTMMCGSTLLNFSGVIPLGGMIVGYVIAIALLIKVFTTVFPNADLILIPAEPLLETAEGGHD